MKKILMGLLISSFCCLAAADVTWEYDLSARTATRNSDGVLFNITYCEKVNPDEKLPEEAVQDTWYPFYMTGNLDLVEAGPAEHKEEVKGHPFRILVSELRYVIEEGERSTHAHYGEPYTKGSKWKEKRFFKCWACEGTEMQVRLLKRAAGSMEETLVDESSAGMRHVRGVYIKDFTNPAEQDYGVGKITPAPEGIGALNKETLANTLKGLERKLRKL